MTDEVIPATTPVTAPAAVSLAAAAEGVARTDVLATTAVVTGEKPEVKADAPTFDLKASIAKWAGEDKAKLNSLRYNSLEDMAAALFNAKQKIREGSVKAPLKADATADELAEYRRENGIPEAPEGYLEKLPDGLVIGEEDKPIFDSFMKSMHAKNADPAVAQEAVKWYYDFIEGEESKAVEANANACAATEDQLMAEWGGDFPANKNLFTNVIAGMPKELVGENGDGPLYSAVLSDGTQLMNHPEMVRWIVKVARDLHMPTTQLTAENSPGGVSIHDRIAELVKMSGNHDGPYWRGAKAHGLQLELQSLNTKLAGGK